MMNHQCQRIIYIAGRRTGMLEAYDDLLTTDEACEALKIGKNALYALLTSRSLKGYRNGRVWRIPKQAIVEYITEQARLA